MLPSCRRDGIGRFLSRSRFLVFAEFAPLFSDIVISEIRGVQDEQGESPFYKNLAQHFFKMDFKQADFINATQGGQFISDLMPKYPIYVNLLHPKAQGVIGQPFNASRPAMQMLEREGFRHQGYIDVFDAGPTMQAERADIRTVEKSRRLPIADIGPVADETQFYVCTTELANFRATVANVIETDHGVTLTPDVAKALGVSKGDFVRLVEA